MTLSFTRTKIVDVEPLTDGSLKVSWHLSDSLLEADMRLTVRLPDLEMTEAEARVNRCAYEECLSAAERINKVVGIRIGPGLGKIVRGLVGDTPACSEFTEGVLECCNAVILHFTLPVIRAGEGLVGEERTESFRAMLRANPRLVRSCVAFADDSPIMEGLGL